MISALGRAGVGHPRPHLAGYSATVAGLQKDAGSRWFEVYADIAFGSPNGPTYSATGDLVAGNAIVTGSGGFVRVYSATGDLVAGNAVVVASGGFTPPVYSATGDLVAGNAVVVASGGFVRVYTATGDLVAGNAIVTGSGGSTPPVYPATGDLVAGNAVVVGSGSSTPPVYSATGDLVAGNAIVTGSGGFVPVFTATGDLVAGNAVVVGSGTFTALVLLDEAEITIDGVDLSPDLEITGVDLSPGFEITGVDLSPGFEITGVDLSPGFEITGVDLSPGFEINVSLGGEMSVSFEGRSINATESGRILTVRGLGIDWVAAGYSLLLRVTPPSGSTPTEYALVAVSGDVNAARKSGTSGMFPVPGTYKMRVLTTTGILIGDEFEFPVKG